MLTNEQHIRMASRLYECRDAARRLLGPTYAARMTDMSAAILCSTLHL